MIHLTKMGVSMARFDLSEEEWAVIKPLLPVKGRGPVRRDDRMVLAEIFYILRTGAPWRICQSGKGRIQQFTTAMSGGARAVSGRVSVGVWNIMEV